MRLLILLSSGSVISAEFYDAGETRWPDSLAAINEEECPLCGETIELALPWHLEPDCPGG